jgi:GTP-binding protein
MIIKSKTFIKSVIKGDNFFDPNTTQVVFYGRSNVGKSSTINALLNHHQFAKSSSKPGKTTEINFFKINKSFFLVDLPGYGYAKLAKYKRQELKELIEWFVDTHAKKRIHVVVLDSKVGLTDFDFDMLQKISVKKERAILVLNKIDKLNQKELSAIVRKTKGQISEDVQIVQFSAAKKKGVEKFWKVLDIEEA